MNKNMDNVLLVSDLIDGRHMIHYQNFLRYCCKIQYSLQFAEHETFPDFVASILAEEYNAKFNAGFNGSVPSDVCLISDVYLTFDSEADKLEFLLTWS